MRCHCKHLKEYAPSANIPTTCGIKDEFNPTECNAECPEYEESQAHKQLVTYMMLGTMFKEREGTK